MQMELFSLGDAEMAEFRNDMEETVNEAIAEALRKNLYSVDVSFRISVHMSSVNTENTCLVPEYEYKSGYKIGGKYDGGKGKIRGRLGMWRDQEGYWHTQYADQQLSMVE